jgi:hypothetical protein
VTYHVVFDISDRFPDAAIGVVALVMAVAVLVLASRQRSREVLCRSSWLWLGAGGVLSALFNIHNVGIPYGLLFGGVLAIPAFALALLAWRDAEVELDDEHHARARTLAPIAAAGLLLLTSLEGAQQLSAFDLARQVSAGQATVVIGVVQHTSGGEWSWECFAVNGHQYCFDGGPTSVGFHQISASGGPIHDGLQVRVSSIGDVIVRLEIADGR